MSIHELAYLYIYGYGRIVIFVPPVPLLVIDPRPLSSHMRLVCLDRCLLDIHLFYKLYFSAS
jgi:hypothetical protein